MDNRDEGLMVLLESGEPVDEISVISLIGILASRGLGPDTIEGTRFIHLKMNDPRVIALLARRRSAECRAFEVIKQSHWYTEDRWPVPLDPLVKRLSPSRDFRFWVDHRIEFELMGSAQNTNFD